MALCEVRHDAGPEHDEWAVLLRKVADEGAAVLPETTELPLPDRVTLRTTTPKDYLAAYRGHLDGVVQRERIRVAAEPEVPPAIRAHQAQMHERATACWVLKAPQAMEDGEGKPITHMLPESMRHAGRHGPEATHALCAHEITHLAQYRAAGDPAIWDYMASSWPRALEGWIVDWHATVEGHALWAQHLATRRLLGGRADTVPGTKSDYYREIAEANGADAWHAHYERALPFVRHVIDARGLATVNRLWRDTGRWPVEGEITDPDPYLGRLAGMEKALASASQEGELDQTRTS